MDRVRFFCPRCGVALTVPPGLAGRNVHCPSCRHIVLVPTPAAAFDAAEAEAPSRRRGPVSRRECGECGAAFAVDGAGDGEPLYCPECNALLPPETLPSIDLGEAGKAEAGRPALSWAISLVVHAVLFIGLSGITWLGGVGSGTPEFDVGVVTEHEDGSIGSGSADLAQIESPSVASEALEVQRPANIQPIASLGQSTGPAELEPVIGIADASAGGSPGAMQGDWGSFAASGGGRGGGGASFFGLEARGKDFVYVVDYSGSMSRDKLVAAKAELIRSLSALRRNMRYYIVFYNHAHLPMPGGKLVKATEQNKRVSFAWVEQVRANGGTDPRKAMRLALSLEPDAIWLLSDGLFARQAADEIRAANPGARVQVHSIGFFSNAGEPVLRRIAEENRGAYRFVPPTTMGLGRTRTFPRRP